MVHLFTNNQPNSFKMFLYNLGVSHDSIILTDSTQLAIIVRKVLHECLSTTTYILIYARVLITVKVK